MTWWRGFMVAKLAEGIKKYNINIKYYIYIM